MERMSGKIRAATAGLSILSGAIFPAARGIAVQEHFRAPETNIGSAQAEAPSPDSSHPSQSPIKPANRTFELVSDKLKFIFERFPELLQKNCAKLVFADPDDPNGFVLLWHPATRPSEKAEYDNLVVTRCHIQFDPDTTSWKVSTVDGKWSLLGNNEFCSSRVSIYLQAIVPNIDSSLLARVSDRFQAPRPESVKVPDFDFIRNSITPTAREMFPADTEEEAIVWLLNAQSISE